MKKTLCTVMVIFLSATAIALYASDEFYAYHTKVQHSASDYMSHFADIIVVLGEGKQLEFTRQTAYLPRWRTPQSVSTIDDLYPGRDPDYDFNYTYVRLIENTPKKIVVHWRHIPDIEAIEQANRQLNPLVVHGFTGVVHEIFTIYADGKVERVVREAQGTRINDWEHPQNVTTQPIRLTDNGVEHGQVNWGRPGPYFIPAVDGSPVKEFDNLPEPLRKWTFDEGMEDMEEYLIVEEMAEVEGSLEGLMAVFKKGVSGTALAFDGYYSGVLVPEFSTEPGTTYFRKGGVPEFKDAMTVEAWIALDVYPYNVAPIVHHSKKFGKQGFYFGIDPYGHLILTVNGQTASSSNSIELYTWTHVAGVVGDGKIDLYFDGEKAGSGKFSGTIARPQTDFMIGLNTEKERCTDYVRSPMQNIKFIYGIQGLLDELKMYNRRLDKDEIKRSYQAFLPADRASALAKAVLPGEVGRAEKFGATYKKLQFHELWDNMWRVTDFADIVVKFDTNPASVVYWRGTNYAANWVTDNNRWMADQSSEIFTKHGCSEHMADKQIRHSFARVIENNSARVVIHWRYPCVDVGYICTNKRNWSDEYHTIYPDGSAVRKVVWNKGFDTPGFQDIQFFTNPGETALDVVDIQAMTLANIDGKVHKMKWAKPNIIPKNTVEDACIQLLNSKSEYKAYAIYQGGSLGAWGENEQSKYTDDPFAGPWNHWPISFVPSDGRFAVAHDRVTHFALGANDQAPEFGSIVHYGFTNQDIKTLVPRARFWKNPPEVTSVEGAESEGFDKAQKAFVFRAKAKTQSFQVNCSDNSPVVNPCFVIKNWESDAQAEVSIDGKSVKADSVLRQGIERDTDGMQVLVIWLEMESNKPVRIEIKRLAS